MTHDAVHLPTYASIGAPRWRDVAADLAVLATGAAILGLFAISPMMLEHFGLPYISSGGGALSKVHPSTLLALAALALRCVSTRQPLRCAWRLLSSDAGVVVLLAAIATTAVYATLVSKTPATPIVDTFLLPILCFLLLRGLNPFVLRWLALLVAALLAANAMIALYELLRGVHVVSLPLIEGSSSDPTRADAVFDWRVEIINDWRATALLGHPLVNGLLVGCFIVCLLARGSRWMPTSLKLPLLALQIASMFAFGARASLVLTFVVGGALGVLGCADAIAQGKRLPARTVAFGLIAVALAVAAVGVLSATGFFDRTFERFASDAGSAATRTTMLQLLTPFSWSDLLLGPDKDVVATWQRLYGLEFGIESSWLGLALTYGFVVTAMILTGLFAFVRSVARHAGRGATLVLAIFLFSVSATASMSGKTTAFAMAVILVLLFLRKDERQQSLRAVLSLNPGVVP